MPVTIDEVSAEVDSGPRQPQAAERSERPAPDALSLEERLRLAEERAQRLRAD